MRVRAALLLAEVSSQRAQVVLERKGVVRLALDQVVRAAEAGVALGLVYSSRASLCAAVEAGRGVYHSRSKGGLWRKGDTSGAYQTLLRIDLDCDHDAIRFTVSTRSTRARSYARGGGGGGRWAEGGST